MLHASSNDGLPHYLHLTATLRGSWRSIEHQCISVDVNCGLQIFVSACVHEDINMVVEEGRVATEYNEASYAIYNNIIVINF